MLTSWTDATGKAVKMGIVKEAPAFTTAENQVTEQAAQIQNMILQGFDAIVIDAASPNALNGAIKSACDAGITVISFDGIVTAPCAWRLTVDFKGMGAEQVDYLAQRLPQGGNLIQIRGIAGTSIDDAFNVGMLDALKKHPNFHLVSTVYGNWTQTVAQKAVAGVLPGPAEDRGRPDRGRRRLWRRAGVLVGRPPRADHHHGQPPGRARLVEAAARQGTATPRCRPASRRAW